MKNIAIFIDFENIARAVRQHREEERVDLQAILAAVECEGRILIRRAYADWAHFRDYRSDVLQHAVQPIQIFAPRRGVNWKNGADINIAVDAMEAAFRWPELTDFVLVSGDSDFLSLVQRLRENGKTVWGMGLRDHTSSFLVRSCDRFLYYEEIADWLPEDEVRAHRTPEQVLMDTVRSMLDRQGLPGMPPPGTPLRAGSIFSTLQRHNPGREAEFLHDGSFEGFLRRHGGSLLLGADPATGELFVAEKNSMSARTLTNLMQNGASPDLDGASDPLASIPHLVRRAAAALSSHREPGAGQTQPVAAVDLREYLQREIPEWDNLGLDPVNFDQVLRDLGDGFEVTETGGELLVTVRQAQPQPQPPSYPAAAPGRPSEQLSEAQRYVVELRRRRIRHVPVADRHHIIRVLCRIFDEATEPLSLKEAKDRLHEWFEMNEPGVSWDHVNNAVYHLFWTYCFEFTRGDSADELWDRPTSWKSGLKDAEEVIRLCDAGLIRMLRENLGDVDPVVATEVLGDQDLEMLPYFQQLCREVTGETALRPAPSWAG